MIDPKLLEFCHTQTQTRNLQGILDHGSATKAAGPLGVTRQSIDESVKAVKKRAAGRGYAPEYGIDRPTPPGYSLKGASELVDNRTGESVLTWYKTDRDLASRLESAAEAIDAMAEGLKPLPKIKRPTRLTSDLLTQYTITDFHLGAYCWSEETGQGNDWDVSIAEAVLLNAVADMIDGSPKSDECIFLQLGDFLHWDSVLATVTPMSGHNLDGDGRFPKIADMALSLFVRAISMMLEHHGTVRVLMCEGNHDMTSSIWLQVSLGYLFKKNPRVIVDQSRIPFYHHLFGSTFLGYHHGHKVKNKALPGFFSSEPRFRSDWGKAKYSVIHTGHYHHAEQDMSEFGGAIIERHPTLAAPDAYAVRGGYVSWRAAKAITYHRHGGEDSRKVVMPRHPEKEAV